MQALSQSAFLQALGYAIINSLWQMALLWIVVVLLNSLVSLSSHVRYRVALGAQFAGFTWFVVTLQYYFSRCSAAMLEIKELAFSNAPAFVQPQPTNFNLKLWATMLKTEQLLPYLSLAYLLLLLFLVTRWIHGYRRTQLIRSNGVQKIDVEWKLFVQRMSEYLSINRKIKIVASTVIQSPMTIGFFKPMILIPVASLNHLSVPQLEAVILHELAHIKRADYLINLVQSIIEIALFFNPFSQLISRFIRKEREHSCDDWVLQFQYNPTMYAEALLQLAYLNVKPSFAMNATGHGKGDLLSRVRRMLNQKEKSFNYKQQLFAFLLMTGILASIAWFDPSNNANNSNNPTSSRDSVRQLQTVVPEPVMAQADNPLFNPVSFLNSGLKEEIKKVTEDIKQHTAEITTTSISAAHQAMNTAVPAALEAVKNLDLSAVNALPESAEIKESLEKAYAEIKNINFTKLIDTASINSSIRNELVNVKLNSDDLKMSSEDMKKLKVDLSDLAFLKFIPAAEREKVKQSVLTALKASKVNFKFDFSTNTTPAPPVAPVQNVRVSVAPDAPITINGVRAEAKGRNHLRLNGKLNLKTRRGKTTMISSGNGATISITGDDAIKNNDDDKDAAPAEEPAPAANVDDNSEEDHQDRSTVWNKARTLYEQRGASPEYHVNGYQAYSAGPAVSYNTQAPANYTFTTNNSFDQLKSFNYDTQNLTSTQQEKLSRLVRYMRAVKRYKITRQQVASGEEKKNDSVVVEIVVYQ